MQIWLYEKCNALDNQISLSLPLVRVKKIIVWPVPLSLYFRYPLPIQYSRGDIPAASQLGAFTIMGRFIVYLLFTFVLTSPLTTFSQAPGALDPSFGNGGMVQIAMGTEDRANAMVLQPDGKLVVAGKTRLGAVRFDYVIARFNTNGSLDTTFGTGGKVVTSLGFQGGSDDEAIALALQPNGKLVAVGNARGSSGGFVATGVVRYNSNGTLDQTFGTGGITLIQRSVDKAVALQADGKIVCGGGNASSEFGNYQLARLNRDGSLDNSFGDAGVVVLDFAGNADGIQGLAMQPDGKILAAGQARASGENEQFSLARFNPDGSLDTTFDGDGKVRTDFDGRDDFGYAVVLQPDGKIIVSGEARTDVNAVDFGLVRYNPDGSLDTGFGVNGRVRTPMDAGWDTAFAVKLQPNGKIVAAGVIGPGGFAVARYNADGSLDTGFAGGKTFAFFAGTDQGRALVIQPDGRIVVAGTADGGGILGEVALARFFGDQFTGMTGSISGRVLDANGNPARLAVVSLGGEQSGRVYSTINPFGYYRFIGLPLGTTYTISVVSKRDTFATLPVLVNGDVPVDLQAEP